MATIVAHPAHAAPTRTGAALPADGWVSDRVTRVLIGMVAPALIVVAPACVIASTWGMVAVATFAEHNALALYAHAYSAATFA